jgi:hypothetical protein
MAKTQSDFRIVSVRIPLLFTKRRRGSGISKLISFNL